MLLAWVLGTAAQLLQPVLWPAWAYGTGLLAVASLVALVHHNLPHAFKLLATMLLVACIAFASVGCRALWFQSQSLSPSLEALDVHTGGALSVQQLQPQLQVLTSIVHGQALFGQWPMQRCEAGQAWQWDGVMFDVLHPLPADYEQPLSPNARSCVLRISTGQQVALLTADIEAFQEQALSQRAGAQLRADVLLVPHHGSKTSSTESFIEAVQPRWALFQMGYRNRYGHPAPQVLQRYVQRGIGVRLSPSCGAMTWRSDDPEMVLCERAQNRRYWRYQPLRELDETRPLNYHVAN